MSENVLADDDEYGQRIRDMVGMHAAMLNRGHAGFVEFDRWLAAHDAEMLAQGIELAWAEIFNPEEESENDSIRYGLAGDILTNLATLIRARGGKP